MSKSVASARYINGIDVEELSKTISAIRATPGIAKFKFRLRNEWIDGGHNRSTVKGFHGAFEDLDHQQVFELHADEPAILLGKDQGPNPVEHLLNALAACVTTALVYHAAARGIAIEEVESSLEGDLDLHGFLGLDPDARRGYENIRAHFKIKADVPDEQLEDLVQLGPTYSPVFDTLTRGVSIQVTGERKNE